jgi:hypothetical protein
MTAVIPTTYRQVLLPTIDGLFAVSIAGDAELDDHGRLVSPRSVFEEGSCLVAVEQEMPPSAQAAREETLLPVKDKQLRSGTFKVHYTEAGKVKLVPVASSGTPG